MSRPLAGLMPGIIDTHIHQWDPFTTPRETSRLAPIYRVAPWLVDRLLPVLADRGSREMVITPEHVGRPFLPATYAADVAGVAEAVGVPVEGVMHVEAGWHRDDKSEETAWVQGLPFGRAGAPPLIGMVASADPRSADFADVLDRHAAASDRFVGIRTLTGFHPDPKVKRWIEREGVLRDPDFLTGFATLAERGLTFDAYVYSHQLSDISVLASEYPETTIVIDHDATPVGWLGAMGAGTGRTDAERAEMFEHWRDAIAAVAAHPNVVSKQSGYAFPMLGLKTRGIGRAELAETVAPMVDHAVDVFGPDRLMCGSNFPMDKSLVAYPDLVGALADILAPRGPDLLRKTFRDNALRLYDWSPVDLHRCQVPRPARARRGVAGHHPSVHRGDPGRAGVPLVRLVQEPRRPPRVRPGGGVRRRGGRWGTRRVGSLQDGAG